MISRKLAAILSIDIVGYSAMMQRNSTGLLSALNELFNLTVKPLVKSSHGRVVKLLGDGALVEFSSAYHAVECAVEIQKQMGSSPPYTYDEVLQLRMGIHVGDVLREGADIFGDCVNIAARLQAEAQPGGILLSDVVVDLAGADLPFGFRHEGSHSFKNIAKPIVTMSVDFSDVKLKRTRENLARSLEVKFCKSRDGLGLAWTSAGKGARLIKAPNWIGHLEQDWQSPGMGHLLGSLSSSHNLIYFDSRGNGLSDWDIGEFSFENLVDDLECVFDACGVERAPIIALSQGSAIAAAFAARSPERVSAIVMIGGFAVGRAKRNLKKDREWAKAFQAMMVAGWDDEYPSLRDLIAQTIIPGASVEDQRRYAKIMRSMISPENLGRYREVIDDLDVSELLEKVQAPCLVIHAKGDRQQPIEQGRKLAAGLTNSKFISIDSDNHLITEFDPVWPMVEREILTFFDEHQ